MTRSLLQLSTLLFLTAVWLILARPSTALPAENPVQLQQLTLTNLDLTDTSRYEGNAYLSDILTAPIPFNAVVPHWQTAGSLVLELRTGREGVWTEWTPIHTDHDLSQPQNPAVYGQLTFAAELQTEVQFKLYATTPTVEQLTFTFIDSTAGPTLDEALAIQAEINAQTPADISGGYPKPAVISRQAWCGDSLCRCTGNNCGNGCVDSDTLNYSNVQFLIVHHTVSNNASTDWPAVVRAIWSYHALSQCWGDIGYNYLIDPFGNIYEGHRGGDDVVGTHSAQGNRFSMAASLLGTFTLPNQSPPGIHPPAAMQNALVELFAWKADQKDIDVYSASYHPDLGSGRPHLMGHRDVLGTTACPGEAAHDLLPTIRDRVAQAINFTPPHIYIDELSPAFTKSNSNWREGPGQCGFNVHSYYTWSTSNPAEATFWGEWRLNVPAVGRYEVEVYAPYCYTQASETNSATYTVYHANGVSTAVANHNDNVGEWISIGSYDFAPNSNHRLRLTDLAQDNGNAVWFDAVRYRYLGPTAALQQPPANSWLNNPAVNFQWQTANSATVTGVQLRVANNNNMNNLLLDLPLAAEATSHSHTFGPEHTTLYWQILLFTSAGQTVYSAVSQFGLDTIAPTSLAHQISWNGSGYVVGWQGQDAGSGLTSFKVEYRPAGGEWLTWLANTTQTSGVFTPPQNNVVYELRTQATDLAGNVEPPHATADVSTAQIPAGVELVSPADNMWHNNLSVTFEWELLVGTTAPNLLFQIATEPSFTNLIVNETLPGTDTQYVRDFIEEHPLLYWRVGASNAPLGSAPVGRLRLDVTAPVSAITGLYRLPNGQLHVVWAGADNGSGVAVYNIDVAPAGSESWQTIAVHTSQTNLMFAPPAGDVVYKFRAQAIDQAGNVEPLHPGEDMNSSQAIELNQQNFLPLIRR